MDIKVHAVTCADHKRHEYGYVKFKAGSPNGTKLCTISEAEKAVYDAETSYNAVITFMLGKGYMEEPLEFLRCWNEGDFETCRKEWPEAPEECYHKLE